MEIYRDIIDSACIHIRDSEDAHTYLRYHSPYSFSFYTFLLFIIFFFYFFVSSACILISFVQGAVYDGKPSSAEDIGCFQDSRGNTFPPLFSPLVSRFSPLSSSPLSSSPLSAPPVSSPLLIPPCLIFFIECI